MAEKEYKECPVCGWGNFREAVQCTWCKHSFTVEAQKPEEAVKEKGKYGMIKFYGLIYGCFAIKILCLWGIRSGNYNLLPFYYVPFGLIIDIGLIILLLRAKSKYPANELMVILTFFAAVLQIIFGFGVLGELLGRIG